MKTVKFKDPKKAPLTVVGVGQVTNENLTPELYEKVIKVSDNFAKYFEVKEESKTKKDEANTEKK